MLSCKKFAAGGCSVAVSNGRTMSHRISLHSNTRSEGSDSVGKYALFEKFCHSGLCRLGLEPIDHLDLCGVWDKLAPFTVCYLYSGYCIRHIYISPFLECSHYKIFYYSAVFDI